MLVKLQRGFEGDPEDGLQLLRNLEMGFKLHPGHKPELVEEIMKELGDAATNFGVSTSIDMKLLAPVFAGQRLDYEVTLTREFDNKLRFEVEACVASTSVAKGVLTASTNFTMPTGVST
jgi:hypothetical protein